MTDIAMLVDAIGCFFIGFGYIKHCIKAARRPGFNIPIWALIISTGETGLPSILIIITFLILRVGVIYLFTICVSKLSYHIPPRYIQ